MPAFTNSLPNFFIVGAPKTGTTSLYQYLDQHPEIYLSPVKEPCFFAPEMRPENFSPEFAGPMRRSRRNLLTYLDGPMSGPNPGGIVTEWNDYLKLFQNVTTEIAIGEASVCYLWSTSAAANIYSGIPDARIIAILRDPVERAFSQYLQYAASGLVRSDFRQHVDQCMHSDGHPFGPLHPFLEYGLYYEQVKRYLDFFPRAQMRIYLYEEVWQTPSQFLADLFDLLAVDPRFEVDTSRKNIQGLAPRAMNMHYLLSKSGVVPGIKKLTPSTLKSGLRKVLFKPHGSIHIDPKVRQLLQNYYRADIQHLSTLLERDLGDWLD